jgi:hypothetical protein
VSRNQHHRQRDHFGNEFDTSVELNGAVGAHASGSSLHTLLGSLVRAGLSIVLDGTNNPITTGVKGDVEIPFDCTLTSVRLFGDQAGSLVVDIWKDVYANFPPTASDSICASSKPTLAAAQKAQDVVLSGWVTAFARGDVLRFNVDSNNLVKRLTISLGFVR